MLKDWIQKYQPKNEEDIVAALREIMQEITLAGLSRTNFYEKAAFYGGTALRIFYKLDRYSEDLDFSLLKKDPNFSLEPYFSAIINEFEALGLKVRIKEKAKKIDSAIDSAFLKSETIWKTLTLDEIPTYQGVKLNKTIKIKIEVDRDPPLGFETEEKLLLQPYSFYVNCLAPPDLFAGKLHALLFRKWKNRVKGRDWYDFEWYVQQGIPLHLEHFLIRAQESGDWHEDQISKEQIKNLLANKINSVSFDRVKEDIVRFIQNSDKLNIWSPKYFHDLKEQMRFLG
jgi:predicted nucleotidyltransferase component of viral defense system